MEKGRSIFSRATENGPAFCECFVSAQRSAGPLTPGGFVGPKVVRIEPTLLTASPAKPARPSPSESAAAAADALDAEVARTTLTMLVFCFFSSAPSLHDHLPRPAPRPPAPAPVRIIGLLPSPLLLPLPLRAE